MLPIRRGPVEDRPSIIMIYLGWTQSPRSLGPKPDAPDNVRSIFKANPKTKIPALYELLPNLTEL